MCVCVLCVCVCVYVFISGSMCLFVCSVLSRVVISNANDNKQKPGQTTHDMRKLFNHQDF